MLSGYAFWQGVDELNGFGTLRALAKSAGIPYKHMMQQRANCSIPKAIDLMKISKALSVPAERLLTGTRPKLSEEAIEADRNPIIRQIVRKCLRDPDMVTLLSSWLETPGGFMVIKV